MQGRIGSEMRSAPSIEFLIPTLGWKGIKSFISRSIWYLKTYDNKAQISLPIPASVYNISFLSCVTSRGPKSGGNTVCAKKDLGWAIFYCYYVATEKSYRKEIT